MFRAVVASNAGAAKGYFSGSFGGGSYYTNDQELPGVWCGLGASGLGLSGFIEQADFDALCDNVHPKTKQAITPRTKAGRRVGYDFNFHCPKSVSIAALVAGDTRIVEAFRKSIRFTMEELEREMLTRVRIAGEQSDRKTGNLAWGEFIHTTARPVDGVIDCHLHGHCFAFNLTYDSKESRWKAGQFGIIKKEMPHYEALFHGRFRELLHGLGYETQTCGRYFEITGYRQSDIDVFSNRSRQIEARAKELGIADDSKKDLLGAKTREKKQNETSLSELQAGWRQRVSKETLERLTHAKGNSPISVLNRSRASESVDFALKHLLERHAAVPERMLQAEAVKHGVGKAAVKDIIAEAKSRDLVRSEVKGQTFITTKEILKQEERVVEFCRDGRGRHFELVKGLGSYKAPKHLTEEQQQAHKTICNSKDRVTFLRGAAGTGKTTLMKSVVQEIQNKSLRPVFAFAPTTDATEVLRQEGFKNANTVAKLLVDEKLQGKLRKGVMWVDEAGLLSTNDISKLTNVAEQQNARMIFTGDYRQHDSVARGTPFSQLARDEGATCFETSNVMRQKGAYKEASEAMSRGELSKGLSQLEELGWVHQMPQEKSHKRIAAKYAEAKKRDESVLVVSPTHKEGEKVNDAIREKLKEEGLVGKQDRKLTRLKPLHWTDAEKKESANYRSGQMVSFHQNVPALLVSDDPKKLPGFKPHAYQGFRAGDKTEVMGRRLSWKCLG